MSQRRASVPCIAALLACLASPAMAAELLYKATPVVEGDWRAIEHAIYENENLIALLEANPQTDDGYKAPIIAKARAEIFRLRAMLPRAQFQWVNPCCYSRKPIYVR
jgi:hypothetical protein